MINHVNFNLRLSNTSKTMPNLKVFTNELLGELMSSLEQDQPAVRIKAFALAKKTFAKTNHSSHIHFLGKCLKKKLLPSGFEINFHSGFDVANGLPLQQVRASIFSCSCRLMRLTILSMKRINDNLTVEMFNSRDTLKEQCDALLYSRVTHLIHRLNRQLYERLCRVKNDKINHLSATQSIPTTNEPDVVVNGHAEIPTNTDKLVVTIPEDLSLGDDERSLLAKGVNFIPTTPVTDEFQVK